MDEQEVPQSTDDITQALSQLIVFDHQETMLLIEIMTDLLQEHPATREITGEQQWRRLLYALR